MKTRSVANHTVNFSLKKEVFFVVIGSLVGAFTMFIPRTILDVAIGTHYYSTWIIFSKIVGLSSPAVGFLLHLLVATVIGIATGVILYKGKILNISKFSNGIAYGLVAGTVVYLFFFLPVNHFLLMPNTPEVRANLVDGLTVDEARTQMQENFVSTLADVFLIHLIWGITVGVVSSLLTINAGANYRCHQCDIEFAKLKTYEHHYHYVHENPSPYLKHVVILGGGFGGIQVLKKLQHAFEQNVNVQITLVSEDNFFLFTPMLPEISSSMLDPRHITTPVRTFCKRAKFYEAEVKSVNLQRRSIRIARHFDAKEKELNYDYLVISLGSHTNFFGNKNVQSNSLTIKSLGDAMSIRNHVITMLESADQEEDRILKKRFLTFVVVGGGFSGVETVGEINDFVREAVTNFYRNQSEEQIRVVLVAGGNSILPEVGEELGRFALESIRKQGVEVVLNKKVKDAGADYVVLDDGSTISCNTLIWAGGVAMDPVVRSLDCKHDKRGRIAVDQYLRVQEFPEVFAVGDCAMITDKNTGEPYPPTAQHAIRGASVVSDNLEEVLKSKNPTHTFNYKTKGTMAIIGKRTGVALLMGRKVRGFVAWLIWRQYYLANMPSAEKKIRVAVDWIVDLVSKRDITRLRNIKEKEPVQTDITAT